MSWDGAGGIAKEIWEGNPDPVLDETQLFIYKHAKKSLLRANPEQIVIPWQPGKYQHACFPLFRRRLL